MYYSEYLEIMKKIGNPLPSMIRETYEYNTTLGAYATEISSKHTTMNFENKNLLSPKNAEPNIYYEQMLLNIKLRKLFTKLNKINMDF